MDIGEDLWHRVAGEDTCDAVSVPQHGNHYWSTACDPPFDEEADTLPDGDGGTLVVIGDSFTAGEGAPQVLAREAENTVGQGYWAAQDYYVDGTDDTGNRCHQSPESYGWLLAESHGLTLDFRACSGATSDNWWESQENRLDPSDPTRTAMIQEQGRAPFPADTEAVIVGFGGNDVQFAPVVKACLIDDFLEGAGPYNVSRLSRVLQLLTGFNCEVAIQDRIRDMDVLLGLVGDADADGAERAENGRGIPALFREVRDRVPNGARIIAVSYPRMFPTDPQGACSIGSGLGATMGEDEQRLINSFVEQLNSRLKDQATLAGIDFVDMTDAYTDHGMCVNEEPNADTMAGRFINRMRLGQPVNIGNADSWRDVIDLMQWFPELAESVHPNVVGQRRHFLWIDPCYQDRSACSNQFELNRQADVIEERERLATYDWRHLAFSYLGCESRAQFARTSRLGEIWDNWPLESVTLEDLTPREDREVAVVTSCPTQSNYKPLQMVVFTMPDEGLDPESLGTMGEGLSFFSLAFERDGEALNVRGPTMIPRQSQEGFDNGWASLNYSWEGSAYRLQDQEEAYTTQPIVHEGLPDGEYFGYLVGVGDHEAFFDQYDMLYGPEADAYCEEQELGVIPGSCSYGWPVDVDGDRVLAMRVADDAPVQYNIGNGTSNAVGTADDLTSVPRHRGFGPAGIESGVNIWAFTVVDGEVIGMTQNLYAPGGE
ncbi:SGNH/GDSL hydrolase family protein [Geodermatophilus nigrescens]